MPERCSRCGAVLAAANKTGECFRHKVSSVDDDFSYLLSVSSKAEAEPDLPEDPEVLKVLRAISDVSGCTVEEILVPSRIWSKELADARNLAIYLLQEDLGRDLAEVARIFRRLSTKISWIRPNVERMLLQNLELRHAVAEVRGRISGRSGGSAEKTEEVKTKQFVDAAEVLRAVCEAFSVSLEDVIGDTRVPNIVRARHFAMYLLRSDLQMPLQEIGRRLNRDHTSVLHGIRRIKGDLSKAAQETINEIRRGYRQK